MLTASEALKLAVQHHQAGELAPAEKLYRAVLRIEPGHSGVYYNLGSILQKQDRIDEAIACYRHALKYDPRDAMCYRALGTAFKAHGNLPGAAECFRTALTLRPAYAEAYNNLGNTLLDQGELSDAIESYRSATHIKPDFAGFHFNLGNALLKDGRLEEAEESFRRTVSLKPKDAEGWNSLGIALFDQGRITESLACYETALQVQPDHPRGRYNRALAWLVTGDWERGWPEYEWRWHVRDRHAPPCNRPRWTGSRRPQQTLLLEAEQGLGDTIQFVRFASLARERVGRIVLRCQRPLLQLLEGVNGVDEIFADDDPPTHCDCWLPLMSLPAYLGTSISTIPPAPYLSAEPNYIARWQRELSRLRGLRIGIQWQGNPANPKDRYRSFPLRCFASLAGMENVHLINLQKGSGSDQLRSVSFPVLDLGSRLDEHTGAFVETAAVMKCLDLVITADTSIGHLAGALGVPTWIPLSIVPEWRWLTGRNDSPWYPSVRLFRQSRRDVWEDVFASMRRHLPDIANAASVAGRRNTA